MNKRLEELRDKGAQEHLRVCHAYLTDMEPSKVSPKFSYAAGFDAAIAELMPRVDELITSLRTIEVPVKNIYSTDDIKQLKHIIGSHQTLATVTLTEWREFMGEGK